MLPNGCAEIPDQMSSVQKGELLLASRGIDQDGQSSWFSLVSGQDRVLIDWESTVGYGEIPWAEFVSERPAQTHARFLVDDIAALISDDYSQSECPDCSGL